MIIYSAFCTLICPKRKKLWSFILLPSKVNQVVVKPRRLTQQICNWITQDKNRSKGLFDDKWNSEGAGGSRSIRTSNTKFLSNLVIKRAVQHMRDMSVILRTVGINLNFELSWIKAGLTCTLIVTSTLRQRKGRARLTVRHVTMYCWAGGQPVGGGPPRWHVHDSIRPSRLRPTRPKNQTQAVHHPLLDSPVFWVGPLPQDGVPDLRIWARHPQTQSLDPPEQHLGVYRAISAWIIDI